MADLTLKAAKREVLGKKTRFLRKQGITPTHLFGHGIKSMALQCNTAELKQIIAKGGTTRLIDINLETENHPRSAFIREIQRDEISGQLLHVDFYQIKKTEKITANIPIILIGEAPALKSKDNMLEQLLNEIGVECLPEKLPPQIEVNLNHLEETGQSIHVRDIALKKDISIITDPEQIIVKISRIKVTVEKEEVEEEVVEEVEVEAVEAEAGPVAKAETEKESKEQA
ncbi:MAG: 50S ribosomal protein L25 [Dehalococcoidia bacterium]|nr:MAG: 50S ribosomal protein L25 [Dehalococcoidia bacterium]